MKYFILLIITLSSYLGFAQNQPWDPRNPEHLKETGKMFTIQIVPGKKQASFYVLGNKTAEIKFNKLKVEATVFTAGQEHKVQLLRKKDHFVSEAPLVGDEIELNVQGEGSEQTEKLRIKLKQP